jgi:hypothetical protein
MKKIKIRFSSFNPSKRQIFVLATLILTLGLVATQLLTETFRYPAVFLLGVFAYFLSAFCLRDNLKRHEWVTLLILPTLFTLSVSYFYFLLPVRWITRLPVALFYALSFYALLLTENIFNVSRERTIQLIRAAQTIGFYLTLVTGFLFLDILISLHLDFYFNVLIGYAAIFLLLLQYFWSLRLSPEIEKSVIVYSSVISFLLSELILVFSFWPVKTLNSALFLTSCFYVFLGIGGYEIQEKLFKRVIIEFIAVPSFVFILILLSTSWTS